MFTWEDDVVAEKCDDGIHVYATEVLSLCLIWHGFHDAIREGDGERVLLYWKILLVVFKSSNQRNYGKEAVNMLLQYYYILSDREDGADLSTPGAVKGPISHVICSWSISIEGSKL